jgi:hypothetical protein
MGRDEVETKYATLAGKALPAARVRRVHELVSRVDTLEDVRLLAAELGLAGA